MGNETQIIEVIHIGAGIILLWILFLCFRGYWLDDFRCRLFSVRNAFFDDAAKGILPFNHPAYRMTRESINALIRFGHRIHPIQILLFMLAYRLNPRMGASVNFDEKIEKECENLPQQAVARIMTVRRQTRAIVFNYIVYQWLLVVFPIAGFIWLVGRCSAPFRRNRWNSDRLSNNASWTSWIEHQAQIIRFPGDSHSNS